MTFIGQFASFCHDLDTFDHQLVHFQCQFSVKIYSNFDRDRPVIGNLFLLNYSLLIISKNFWHTRNSLRTSLSRYHCFKVCDLWGHLFNYSLAENFSFAAYVFNINNKGKDEFLQKKKVFYHLNILQIILGQSGDIVASGNRLFKL